MTERLPPYFSISPQLAEANLPPPVGTDRFAEAATRAAQGRDDLLSRGHGEDGKKTLRRFSTWEITRYLIPVAPAHFRRVLRANSHLPQGSSETESGAKWFTLAEVEILREHFAREGRGKDYKPPAGNRRGRNGRLEMPVYLCLGSGFLSLRSSRVPGGGRLLR